MAKIDTYNYVHEHWSIIIAYTNDYIVVIILHFNSGIDFYVLGLLHLEDGMHLVLNQCSLLRTHTTFTSMQRNLLHSYPSNNYL